MKVTTEPTGNRTKVVVEESGNQANAIRTAELTVDGSGLLSYSAFEGKSIGFIKQYFKGEIDGDNIIGRDATTLDSDGVLDLGQVYAGQTVYLTQLGETFYTSDAKEYADQAEASANNAATSAVDAQTAQTAAEAAQTNAAASASAASTSETNAANSASAAATSETNAASSASAASTSETNAANSASAASTSETNAANSASAASTSESNAATSATEAEAARDEITDKIPFAEFNDNDVIQWNDSADDFEGLSREDFGKQKELLSKSAIYGTTPQNNSFKADFWDNFNRANGAIGTADSGQTYSYLIGSAGSEISDFNLRNFGGKAITIPLSSVGLNLLSGKFIVSSGNGAVRAGGFGFFVDASNYAYFDYTSAGARLVKVVAGISTVLSSSNSGLGFELFGAAIEINFFASILTTGEYVLKVACPIFESFNTSITGVGGDIETIMNGCTQIGFFGSGGSFMISGFKASRVIAK